MTSKKTTKKNIRRRLKGKVVSDKMDKTLTVQVMTLKKHPLYKKRYRTFKKYLAHNEKKGVQLGDKVVIEECQPVSKRKKWQIVKKISKKS